VRETKIAVHSGRHAHENLVSGVTYNSDVSVRHAYECAKKRQSDQEVKTVADVNKAINNAELLLALTTLLWRTGCRMPTLSKQRICSIIVTLWDSNWDNQVHSMVGLGGARSPACLHRSASGCVHFVCPQKLSDHENPWLSLNA
jgi:hypothetical protein